MFLISCRLLFFVSFSHVEYCSNVYNPEIYLFFSFLVIVLVIFVLI